MRAGHAGSSRAEGGPAHACARACACAHGPPPTPLRPCRAVPCTLVRRRAVRCDAGAGCVRAWPPACIHAPSRQASPKVLGRFSYRGLVGLAGAAACELRQRARRGSGAVGTAGRRTAPSWRHAARCMAACPPSPRTPHAPSWPPPGWARPSSWGPAFTQRGGACMEAGCSNAAAPGATARSTAWRQQCGSLGWVGCMAAGCGTGRQPAQAASPAKQRAAPSPPSAHHARALPKVGKAVLVRAPARDANQPTNRAACGAPRPPQPPHIIPRCPAGPQGPAAPRCPHARALSR